MLKRLLDRVDRVPRDVQLDYQATLWAIMALVCAIADKGWALLAFGFVSVATLVSAADARVRRIIEENQTNRHDHADTLRSLRQRRPR